MELCDSMRFCGGGFSDFIIDAVIAFILIRVIMSFGK